MVIVDSNLSVAEIVDAMSRAGDTVYVWDRSDDSIVWLDDAGLDSALASITASKSGADLSERFGDEHAARRAIWLSRPRPIAGFRATHCVMDDGTPCWVEERLVRLQNSPQDNAIYIGFLRNVSELHNYHEKLTYLACFDDLTGHLTRARLRTVLAQTLVASFAEDRVFCFAFIGLDNMVGVNHAFGYDVADEVLIGVGQRIKSELSETETIGRVASSKFGVIFECSSLLAVEKRLLALQSSIRDEFIMTGSGPVAVTVSIGALALPDQARTTQDAFAAAEDALTAAKGMFPSGFAFYQPDAQEVETRKSNISMADELSAALREDRICLAFQPIVNAQDTSKIVFHECLARMLDRNGELVAAAKFMPVAEQLGFVRLIDRRVLELAFDVLLSDPNLRLSINLSPQTMHDGGWCATFEKLSTAHPSAVKRLIVEITESYAIQDSVRSQEWINSIKAKGCALALDDFGAGYTSFKYFKTLKLDIVKIDGSYIRGLCDSPDNQLFVRSLAQLAVHYGMVVVAEMVDNHEAGAILKDLGVDCFQGNFFGPAEVVGLEQLSKRVG